MAKKKYLRIELTGQYLETEYARGWLGSPRPSFRELLKTVESAGADRRVKLIIFSLSGQALTLNQIQELGSLIEEIRRQGTPCWAFLEEGQLSGYTLACSCERILLPQPIMLNLLGFRLEQVFFRDFLEEWGIEPEFQAKGKYKSASEMFTHNEMSEPAREMMTSLLEQVRDHFVEKVSLGRKLSPERVLELIDDAPFSASRALEAGLVDQLAYDDEIQELVEKKLGSARKAKLHKYAPRESWLQRLIRFRRPRIAYLVAEGIILGSSGSPIKNRPTVDSKTLRGQLKKARENKKIRAVVLRINSPGGDATISDLIWREIQQTNEKKPVIASFGDKAASGGYYLASAAGHRLAMPGTITGSIGVIGGKFSARRLLERFKLHSDSLDLGERSGIYSPLREQTESEKQALDRQLQDVYDLFLERVASGTGKPLEEVLEHAGGRVWSGKDAARLGLVNGIGGIRDAFQTALGAAGLPQNTTYRTISFTRKQSLLASLLSDL